MTEAPRAPAQPSPRQAFLDALGELHAAAGCPSTRDIARATPTGFSHTAIAETLRGATFPTWPLMEEMVTVLGGDPEAIRGLWAAARRAGKSHPPVAARHEGVDVVALTNAVRGLVQDLDSHIERRAAELAAPRVEAAELACDAEMDEVLARASLRTRRHDDLVREKDRQIAQLVKTCDRLQAQMKRLDEHMRTLDPAEAAALRAVLHGTPSGTKGARR